MSSLPFSPEFGNSKKLSVTTSSSRVQLGVGKSVLIANLGTNKAFVKLGDSSVAATVDVDLVVLPSSYVMLTRGVETDDYIAGICDSTESATLYIATGQGN